MQAAVDRTVAEFGGIDILGVFGWVSLSLSPCLSAPFLTRVTLAVNNASAISLTPTEATPMKRYDLMHSVNARGTFLCSKLCLPHLRKSSNPHILNLVSSAPYTPCCTHCQQPDPPPCHRRRL